MFSPPVYYILNIIDTFKLLRPKLEWTSGLYMIGAVTLGFQESL